VIGRKRKIKCRRLLLDFWGYRRGSAAAGMQAANAPEVSSVIGTVFRMPDRSLENGEVVVFDIKIAPHRPRGADRVRANLSTDGRSRGLT
jgi:hypothetical protein